METALAITTLLSLSLSFCGNEAASVRTIVFLYYSDEVSAIASENRFKLFAFVSRGRLLTMRTRKCEYALNNYHRRTM